MGFEDELLDKMSWVFDFTCPLLAFRQDTGYVYFFGFDATPK